MSFLTCFYSLSVDHQSVTSSPLSCGNSSMKCHSASPSPLTGSLLRGTKQSAAAASSAALLIGCLFLAAPFTGGSRASDWLNTSLWMSREAGLGFMLRISQRPSACFCRVLIDYGTKDNTRVSKASLYAFMTGVVCPGVCVLPL